MTKKGKRLVWSIGIAWVLLVLLCVAVADGKPAFYYRVMRLCQICARILGEWGMTAENEYHRLMALERMN